DHVRHPVVDRPLYRHDDDVAGRGARHEADPEVASGKKNPAVQREAHRFLHGARLDAMGANEGQTGPASASPIWVEPSTSARSSATRVLWRRGRIIARSTHLLN